MILARDKLDQKGIIMGTLASGKPGGVPARVIKMIICSSYLSYKRNDNTSHNRPKYTENRVLVEESSANRHNGASTLWTIQIKWSDKQ